MQNLMMSCMTCTGPTMVRSDSCNLAYFLTVDAADQFAAFSNYGNPPIDYSAPGVSILSTWKDNSYNSISGTSMASPHAAGVFLLGDVSTSGYVVNDVDDVSDEIIYASSCRGIRCDES